MATVVQPNKIIRVGGSMWSRLVRAAVSSERIKEEIIDDCAVSSENGDRNIQRFLVVGISLWG
jgi:hypothetical protein